MLTNGAQGAKVFADRYRRLGRLGTGGMASVFLAKDELLGRDVAIKRLHSAAPEELQQRSSPPSLKRFFYVLRPAAALRWLAVHPDEAVPPSVLARGIRCGGRLLPRILKQSPVHSRFSSDGDGPANVGGW